MSQAETIYRTRLGNCTLVVEAEHRGLRRGVVEHHGKAHLVLRGGAVQDGGRLLGRVVGAARLLAVRLLKRSDLIRIAVHCKIKYAPESRPRGASGDPAAER